MTEPERDPLDIVEDVRADEDDGRIGIFPSWAWLYGTVIVYGVLMIVLLRFLTVTMNVDVAP